MITVLAIQGKLLADLSLHIMHCLLKYSVIHRIYIPVYNKWYRIFEMRIHQKVLNKSDINTVVVYPF